MDEFGLYPREEPFDPLGVMLFKALQVIAFLFFIALLSVSPDSKDGKIDSKAEFIITMDWPDSHPDDLDLFVAGPCRQHCLVPSSRGRFPHPRPRRSRRRQRFHHRQRQEDCLADSGRDRHRARHRRRRIYRQRLALSGHHRAARGGERESAKLNPTAQVIFDNKLMLDHTGEERTAVRFRLDAEGKVVDVHQRSKSLLETFRNLSQNGADLDPKTGVRMPRRE